MYLTGEHRTSHQDNNPSLQSPTTFTFAPLMQQRDKNPSSSFQTPNPFTFAFAPPMQQPDNNPSSSSSSFQTPSSFTSAPPMQPAIQRQDNTTSSSFHPLHSFASAPLMQPAIQSQDNNATSSSFQTPTPFTFAPAQLKILQDNLPDVTNADTKNERHRMIKDVRKQVLNLPECRTLNARGRENLKAAIDTWFRARSKRQTNKIKFGKTWNARLVLYEEHKEEVHEIQARLFEKAQQEGKDPQRHFDFFQRAVTKLWRKQGKSAKKVLQKQARKWNKEGVSREQRQRYVIIVLSELAETHSECIARPTNKHGNTLKNSLRTCTSPSGFDTSFLLHWRHRRAWLTPA